MTGLFVTLEGGEGTGKSTLCRALADAFAARDLAHTVTREPGGTPVAEKVREIALAPREEGPLSALAMALLMNAARADHLDTLIRPALSNGHIVLCDRFSDSTRAYQSVQGGVSHSTLLSLEEAVVGETWPDLTLLLDADPAALLDRRRARGGPVDVFEGKQMAFHQAIRDAFLGIANGSGGRIAVLDALQPPGEIAAQALSLIEARRLAKVAP
ncbi:MAG: dTMP kinase [Pseudomonadota bacterium]